METSKFTSEDWDFSKCQPYELQACYMYEFFREYHEAKESIRKWRSQHPGAKFDDWLAAIRNPRDRKRPDVGGYELYAFCPEWPGKAYLSIAPDERRRRLGLLPKCIESHDKRNALRLVHLSASWRWWVDTPETGQDKVSPKPDGPTNCESAFSETICVTVDWRHHPRTIAKRFEKLLLKARPAGVEQWKTKGKGRRQEQLRARLKALGAWRLLVKWKIPWNKAEELTANSNPEGKPLFDGQSRWCHACRRAEHFLAQPLSFDLAG